MVERAASGTPPLRLRGAQRWVRAARKQAGAGNGQMEPARPLDSLGSKLAAAAGGGAQDGAPPQCRNTDGLVRT